LFSYITLKLATLLIIGDPKLNTYQEKIKMDPMTGGEIIPLNETKGLVYHIFRK